MIRYYLSGNQVKEMTERGRRLRVAIPAPDDWPDDCDPLTAARSLLSTDQPGHVISAEVVDVPVQIVSGTGRGPGLTGLLGTVWHGDTPTKGNLIVRVVCLVADLQAGRVARTVGRTQWPGYAMIDGRRYG